MRGVCFIVGLYLLVLFLQPCHDLTWSNICIGGENACVAIREPASDRRIANEECSRFCSCSCSGNPIATTSVELAEVPKDQTHAHESIIVEYSDPHLLAFQTPVWQPPKA